MTGLDIFTFIVMLVLVLAAIFLVVKLGALPGKIAEARQHPQADAIKVCGWIGILTLGLAWPIAFIWAYTRPIAVSETTAADRDALRKENAEVKQAMADISEQLAALEEAMRDFGETERGKGP